MATKTLNPLEWALADQIGYLQPLIRAHGVDWSGVANRFGLPENANDLIGRKIEISVLLALLEFVAGEIDDDAAILDFFSELPQGAFPTFEFVASCAPSLRTGLKNWQRFFVLRGNCIKLAFDEQPEFGTLTWEIPDRFTPRKQAFFAEVAWAASRIEHMALGQAMRLTIELSVPPPKCKSRFQQRNGSHLKFGQAHDRILIPSVFLDLKPQCGKPCPYAEIENAAMTDVDKILQLGSPLNTIKAAISSHLKAGDCKVKSVAAYLGISQRSLQRRLEFENTSFRQLTDTIRQSLASRYLRETKLDLKEIAFLLGYSDLSTFSRSARTWFGMPPSDYRRKS